MLNALGTCKNEIGPSYQTLEGFIVHSKQWNCLFFAVESFICVHSQDATVAHYKC